MFTGIIEEIGSIRHISRQGQAMIVTIGCRRILEDVHEGDSIAVNGVCLTVIRFDTASVTMDVMPETFRRSTLCKLRAGSRVNLERAMSAGGRFGGHVVQGHVDGTGTILAKEPAERWTVVRIALPDRLARYVAEKGSITVDGVSLTVVEAGSDFFTVSLIPTTLDLTTLGPKQPGDPVNLEVDVLAKYVERLLDTREVAR